MFLRRHQLGAVEVDVPTAGVPQVRPVVSDKFRRFAAYAEVAADLMIAFGGAYTVWHLLFDKRRST